METTNKEFIETNQFLIDILKIAHPQADGYDTRKSKKDNWHFWTTNDYPLQHGSGVNNQITDSVVKHLQSIAKSKQELLESLQECVERLKTYGQVWGYDEMKIVEKAQSAISSALGE